MKTYQNYSRHVLKQFLSGKDLYKKAVAEFSPDAKTVLQLGCGRDLNSMSSFFSEGGQVLAIDLDLDALTRYPADAWHVGAENLPFSDSSVDLVFSEYVLEHLVRPEQVFSEVSRVLRPGGRFISLAPNFFSYKSLVAWLTPHSLHEAAVKTLRPDSQRETADVYPTAFKANTSFALRRLAGETNLSIERLILVNNGPTWFQKIPILFEIGRIYHACLELNLFSQLRCNMVSTLRKPGDAHTVELAIRCLSCGSEPMEQSENGFRCKHCERKYLKKDNVFRVLE